jgi:hypothetical protein
MYIYSTRQQRGKTRPHIQITWYFTQSLCGTLQVHDQTTKPNMHHESIVYLRSCCTPSPSLLLSFESSCCAVDSCLRDEKYLKLRTSGLYAMADWACTMSFESSCCAVDSCLLVELVQRKVALSRIEPIERSICMC